MGKDGALFQVVLAAHILCAVVGFGSVMATGGYASLARPRPGRDEAPDAVRRYFRPGPNWASRVIFLVPVLGLVLAGIGGDFARAWLWVGSGLWALAAGVAVAVVWPAERRVAAAVAGGGAAGSLAGPARTASWAAGVVDLAVVAAFVVMIARPQG
ncbi:MAG: DUF2269 family protein [Acidimicrobiales bacterium]